MMGFALRSTHPTCYVATFADVVYVLHAFQNKTRQTAKRYVDLAASRLREQMARMR